MAQLSLSAHILDGFVGVKHGEGSWGESNEGGHRHGSG